MKWEAKCLWIVWAVCLGCSPSPSSPKPDLPTDAGSPTGLDATLPDTTLADARPDVLERADLRDTRADVDLHAAQEIVDLRDDELSVEECPLQPVALTWHRFTGSEPVAITSLAPRPGGGVVVTANVTGSDWHWDGEAIPVVPCDGEDCADGVLLWLGDALTPEFGVRIGGPGAERLEQVAVAESGQVVVVGSSDSQGFVLDECEHIGAGQADGIALAFTPTGQCAWGWSMGDAMDESWQRVSTDGAGGFYLGGSFESLYLDMGDSTFHSRDIACSLLDCGDLVLARVSNEGELLWGRSYGGNQGERFGFLRAFDGDVLGWGQFGSWGVEFDDHLVPLKETICGPMFGCSDLFAVRVDQAGEVGWVKSFGGDLLDTLVSADLGPDGAQFVLGEFSSSGLDFGGGTLVNNGGLRSFVAAIGPDQLHRWSLDVDAFPGAVAVAGDTVIVAVVQTAFHQVWGSCQPEPGRRRLVLAQLDRETGEVLASTPVLEVAGTLEVAAATVSAGRLVIAGSFQGDAAGANGPLEGGGTPAEFLLALDLPLTSESPL